MAGILRYCLLLASPETAPLKFSGSPPESEQARNYARSGANVVGGVPSGTKSRFSKTRINRLLLQILVGSQFSTDILNPVGQRSRVNFPPAPSFPPHNVDYPEKVCVLKLK